MTDEDSPPALKKLEKPVLVTGGGGFLGLAIVRRLLQLGLPVRSFSRRGYSRLSALGVDQIQGDLADPLKVMAAVEGVDLVFHTAAKPPPWGKYADYLCTNTTGTRNLIEACRHHQIAALVHTSSPSVIFDGGDLEGVDESMPYPSRFLSHYARTKALAEQAVRDAAASGLPAIVLRPHEIWGPGDPHFAPRLIARANRLRRIGHGRNRVDTIYIDNAADAHLAAAAKLLRHPKLSGRIYFISQDEPVYAWDMIDDILQAAGLGPVKGRVPYPLAWLTGALCEGIWRGLRLSGEPPMTRFVATALARSHWFDISAAKRDLAFAPKVSTAEGLDRLARWLASSHQKENTP
jgi:nucleoside-diphosphate-sugar epimerase